MSSFDIGGTITSRTGDAFPRQGQGLTVLMSGRRFGAGRGDASAFAVNLDGLLREKVLGSGKSVSATEINQELLIRLRTYSDGGEPLRPLLLQLDSKYGFVFHPPAAANSGRPGALNADLVTSPENGRIAQILSNQSASGSLTFGTGYMIANGVVLTAAAVVPTNACDVHMPFLRNSDQSARTRYPGRVAYTSTALNLALVEIPTSDSGVVAQATIPFGTSHEAYLSFVDCVVFGIQGSGFRDESPMPIRLVGRFRQFGSHFQQSLDIILDQRLRLDTNTFALVGSIVFSGRLAVAVVQSIGSDGRVKASPIDELLRQPEFIQYWTNRGMPAPSVLTLSNDATSEPRGPPPVLDASELILGSLDLVDRHAQFAAVARAIDEQTPVIAMTASLDDLPEIFLRGLSRNRGGPALVDSVAQVYFDTLPSTKDALVQLIAGIVGRLGQSLLRLSEINAAVAEEVRVLLERSGRRNAFYTLLSPGSWSRVSETMRRFVDFWSLVNSRARGPIHPFFIVVLKWPSEDQEPSLTRFHDSLDSKNVLRIIPDLRNISRNDVRVWTKDLYITNDSNAQIRSIVLELEDYLLRNDRKTRTMRALREEILRFFAVSR